MQTTLKNKKKVVVDSPRSALKNKNKVEEGEASSLGVEREHESTENDEGQSGTICSTNSGKGSVTSGIGS